MLNLDLSKVAAQGIVPEGEHAIRCVESEIKEKGDNVFVKVKFNVEDSGMSIYDNFTIKHDNPTAVQVGQSRLKSFLRASGYKNPDFIADVNEMCGLGCLAKVKTKTDDYGEKSVISSFKPKNGTTASAPTATKPPF